jgi:Arc/MetJ family transcription regulator
MERQRPHRDAPATLPRECRFIYEWFSGWRWEQHRADELLAESMQCFDTREECVADASRHQSRAPAAASAGEHALASQLAA